MIYTAVFSYLDLFSTAQLTRIRWPDSPVGYSKNLRMSCSINPHNLLSLHFEYWHKPNSPTPLPVYLTNYALLGAMTSTKYHHTRAHLFISQGPPCFLPSEPAGCVASRGKCTWRNTSIHFDSSFWSTRLYCNVINGRERKSKCSKCGFETSAPSWGLARSCMIYFLLASATCKQTKCPFLHQTTGTKIIIWRNPWKFNLWLWKNRSMCKVSFWPE